MTGRTGLIGFIITLCIVLLCGCNADTKPQTTNSKASTVQKNIPSKPIKPARVSGAELKRIDKTTDEEKVQIIKQLEGKFENPEAHYKLGKCYQADGMWSKAESEFSTALSFDPAYREAQAARVKVLLVSGDKGKAQLLAEDYMNQASNSAAGSLRLGLGFQKEGLDDYALVCYRQALTLAPNSARVNRQVGYYYLNKNQLDLAKSYLMRSFQLDPTQAEVAGELGRLGVVVQVPRKQESNTKKLDDMVDKANKPVKP